MPATLHWMRNFDAELPLFAKLRGRPDVRALHVETKLREVAAQKQHNRVGLPVR